MSFPTRGTRLLDPRHYRVDDLLRRACPPGEARPFFLFGDRLRASISRRAWGFPEGVSPGGPGVFTLDVRADERAVFPEDAICRPSHVTLNGRDRESGLQVIEDKFLTGNDVLVSALSLHNPGEWDVEVEIALGWNVRGGSDGSFWVHREGPPPDDLRQRLAGMARRTLVVAVAFAPSEEEAQARTLQWAWADNPAREQSEAYQRWFEENVPRFDCSDPWMTRLWYHHAHLLRGSRRAWPDWTGAGAASWEDRPARLRAIQTLGRAQFENDDFERPREDPESGTDSNAFLADWPLLVIREILGLRLRDGSVLEMRPLLPEGWSYFCLENLPCRGRSLTVVWDDPASPLDAYDDGDKGLTIYVDGRPWRHQPDLSPLASPLPD